MGIFSRIQEPPPEDRRADAVGGVDGCSGGQRSIANRSSHVCAACVDISPMFTVLALDVALPVLLIIAGCVHSYSVVDRHCRHMAISGLYFGMIASWLSATLKR